MKAPFKVQVKGPGRLLDLGERKYGKWVGCGYWIEWGDGPQSYSPQGASVNCSEGFQHFYAKAGSYTAKASIFHPGSADETIVDWTETIAVIVKGS